MSTILSLLVLSVANALDVAFYALHFLLILRFVLNFYTEGPRSASNPGVVFVFRVTELVLDPVRNKMGIEPRTVDFSLFTVFFAAVMIQTVLVGILRKISSVLGG